MLTEPEAASSLLVLFVQATEGSERFFQGCDWPRRVIVKQSNRFTRRSTLPSQIPSERRKKKRGTTPRRVKLARYSCRLTECSDACSSAWTIGALAASLECCSRCMPTSALLVSIVIILISVSSSSSCKTALDYAAEGGTTCVQ